VAARSRLQRTMQQGWFFVELEPCELPTDHSVPYCGQLTGPLWGCTGDDTRPKFRGSLGGKCRCRNGLGWFCAAVCRHVIVMCIA
jgi:hypothetical protein